jgi:hypothetical protein
MVLAGNVCSQCGKPLKSASTPTIVGNVWRPAPGMFAARVSARELEGVSKQLTLEPGTKAVIYGDGKNLGVVEDSGTITMVSLWSRINNFLSVPDVSAVLYKDGDLELSFRIEEGISTKEGLDINVTVSVAVRIENIALFASRLMGQARVYTIAELEEALRRHAYLCLRKSVGQCGIEELRSDTGLQTMFDQELETALGGLLRPLGIAFRNVRAFDFVHKRYDEMRRTVGEYHLDITEAKANLEQKKEFG